MSEPVAYQYARELLGHMKSLGGTPAEYSVLLSPREAMDLLEWMGSNEYAGHPVFAADLEQAKQTGKPFTMLAQFTYCGLPFAERTLH